MLAVDLMNRFGEASAGKVAEGASDIGQGNYSRGARKVLQGAGTFAGVAGAPLLIPEIAAAGVVPTMAGLLGATAAASVAQPTVEYLGKRVGLSEDQAGLLGDIAGLGVGIKAYGPSQKAPAVLKKVVPKAIGAVSRLPIFDELPVTLAATGLGMATGGSGMLLNALGGRFAGAGANRVIAAARKLGLPAEVIEAAQPLIRSAAQGLKDIGPLVEELSGFKVFTQDALKQGEKVVTAVTEAKAAGLPVPPQAQAQADRVVAANNVFNVETKTVPRMEKIVQQVVNDPAVGGDIELLTDKAAIKLHRQVVEGVDAMDRAGKPVPEELRQVLEGLRDRLVRDAKLLHDDALRTLIDASRKGSVAFDDAVAVLTSTKEGKSTYKSIQLNEGTVLESMRRLAANTGGTLNKNAPPPQNQLLDIVESMLQPARVEVVQVAPESLVNEGFRVPSGVTVTRPTSGAAVSMDTPVEVLRPPVVSANSGGTLNTTKTPRPNLAQDLVESLRTPNDVVEIAPDNAAEFSVPSGVETNRLTRGSAVSVDAPTPVDTALVTLFDAASEGLASFNKAIVELRSKENGELTYGAIQRRYKKELTQLRNLALKSGGKLSTTKRESVDQLRELLEPSFSRIESVQVAPERPVGGGFTAPSGVDVVRTGRGAAVSVDAMPKPVLEATAGSSTTSPQAQTPSTQAPAQPRKRSTVEERAVARGAEPLVSSNPLTPDELRAALSNRPGLQMVLDAQEIQRFDLYDNLEHPTVKRFIKQYERVNGQLPNRSNGEWTPAHNAGNFYAGGQNQTPKAKAINRKIAKQLGLPTEPES
jgi:hypothetical protein